MVDFQKEQYRLDYRVVSAHALCAKALEFNSRTDQTWHSIANAYTAMLQLLRK